MATALRSGVDLGMPRVLPAHLIESRGLNRCSLCAISFDASSKPSISAAFKKHVLEVHRAKEGVAQNGAKTKADRGD